MKKHGIEFTSVTYDDWCDYEEELIAWYKDFIGVEPQENSNYVGWYRVMQSYVITNLTFEQATIAKVYILKDVDLSIDEIFKLWCNSNEDVMKYLDLDSAVAITANDLNEKIDNNALYLFSFSW